MSAHGQANATKYELAEKATDLVILEMIDYPGLIKDALCAYFYSKKKQAIIDFIDENG